MVAFKPWIDGKRSAALRWLPSMVCDSLTEQMASRLESEVAHLRGRRLSTASGATSRCDTGQMHEQAGRVSWSPEGPPREMRRRLLRIFRLNTRSWGWAASQKELSLPSARADGKEIRPSGNLTSWLLSPFCRCAHGSVPCSATAWSK